MASPPHQPHVLLISYPAQGDVNPLLRLAKLLASKGLLVTFSSTLEIAHKLSSSSSFSNTFTSPIPINNGFLRFDFFDDGWSICDPRRNDISSQLLQINTTGRSSLPTLIQRQTPPISAIIHDPFVSWVTDVANELNIPSALLWVQPAAVFSAYYHCFNSLVEFPSHSNPDLEVNLPGLPTFKPDELPTYLLHSYPIKSLTDVLRYQFQVIQKCTWVFVNSFQELEFNAIDGIYQHVRLIPIGPLAACNDLKPEVKGNLWKPADFSIDWLNSQNPNSVVYVSLGSNVTLTEEDMDELANGLLDCGWPFLWVVRNDSQHLLPDGFLERAEGKGKVVPWTSQEEVLGHVCVACFVSHCGWNSTIEALSAGVPIIAYPFRGDQQPNAKFIVEEFGVGARLEAPMKREGVVRCVSQVLGGGEMGVMMKRRASEWKKTAMKAVGPGGSSERNVTAFVEDIVRRAAGGGGEL